MKQKGVHQKDLMINKIGVDDIKMMFDIVFVNPPFNHIPEFEKIAIKHSNQYVWMITRLNYMRDLDKFNNVIYFKNLHIGTFKEKIEICSYLINKNKKKDDLILVDGNEGKTYQTDNIQLIPVPDADAWKYAQDVVSLGLPAYAGYRSCLLQWEAKRVSKGGVKCIWSTGGKKKDIVYDYIDESQSGILVGLGHHKIFTTYRYPTGKLGEVKYSSPNEGLGRASIGVILNSKEECLEVIEYLNTPQIKKLVKGIKLTTYNSKVMWAKIPHHSQKDKWFHLYKNDV